METERGAWGCEGGLIVTGYQVLKVLNKNIRELYNSLLKLHHFCSSISTTLILSARNLPHNLSFAQVPLVLGPYPPEGPSGWRYTLQVQESKVPPSDQSWTQLHSYGREHVGRVAAHQELPYLFWMQHQALVRSLSMRVPLHHHQNSVFQTKH